MYILLDRVLLSIILLYIYWYYSLVYILPHPIGQVVYGLYGGIFLGIFLAIPYFLCPKFRSKKPETESRCVICLEPITKETVYCPYCGKPAHKFEFLKWLKVKGYCPACKIVLSLNNFQKYLNIHEVIISKFPEVVKQHYINVCPHCKKEIPPNSNVCVYCGCNIKERNI